MVLVCIGASSAQLEMLFLQTRLWSRLPIFFCVPEVRLAAVADACHPISKLTSFTGERFTRPGERIWVFGSPYPVAIWVGAPIKVTGAAAIFGVHHLYCKGFRIAVAEGAAAGHTFLPFLSLRTTQILHSNVGVRAVLHIIWFYVCWCRKASLRSLGFEPGNFLLLQKGPRRLRPCNQRDSTTALGLATFT